MPRPEESDVSSELGMLDNMWKLMDVADEMIDDDNLDMDDIEENLYNDDFDVDNSNLYINNVDNAFEDWSQ